MAHGVCLGSGVKSEIENCLVLQRAIQAHSEEKELKLNGTLRLGRDGMKCHRVSPDGIMAVMFVATVVAMLFGVI